MPFSSSSSSGVYAIRRSKCLCASVMRFTKVHRARVGRSSVGAAQPCRFDKGACCGIAGRQDQSCPRKTPTRCLRKREGGRRWCPDTSGFFRGARIKTLRLRDGNSPDEIGFKNISEDARVTIPRLDDRPRRVGAPRECGPQSVCKPIDVVCRHDDVRVW